MRFIRSRLVPYSTKMRAVLVGLSVIFLCVSPAFGNSTCEGLFIPQKALRASIFSFEVDTFLEKPKAANVADLNQRLKDPEDRTPPPDTRPMVLRRKKGPGSERTYFAKLTLQTNLELRQNGKPAQIDFDDLIGTYASFHLLRDDGTTYPLNPHLGLVLGVIHDYPRHDGKPIPVVALANPRGNVETFEISRPYKVLRWRERIFNPLVNYANRHVAIRVHSLDEHGKWHASRPLKTVVIAQHDMRLELDTPWFSKPRWISTHSTSSRWVEVTVLQ